VARPVAGDAVGGVLAEGNQPDRRHAAPLLHVPARLPAAEVRMLGALVGLLLALDHRLQVGIEGGAVGEIEVDDRRRKERKHVEVVTHVLSPAAANGQRGRGAKSSASTMPRRKRSIPAQAIIAPLSVQNLIGGATRRTPSPSSRPRRLVLAATPPATTS